MLKINENNRINARDIYEFVNVKTPYYIWLRRCIDYADLKNGEDFITELKQSTGGRPARVHEFTIDAAKEMCIVSATPRAKELRRWLIGLSKQRESLELVTAKEAAFAFKVINALKYIENQKEALSMHQASYIEREGVSKYVYSDFAKYRAKIIGWDKQKVDQALHEYLMNNAGHNKNKLYKKSMSEKLSVMDVSEAIRVAVLDILFSKGSESDIAVKFANFVKQVSKELDVQPLSKNETNLFQFKESADIKKLLKSTLVLILFLFSFNVSAQFQVQPKAAFEYAGNSFRWVMIHPMEHDIYDFGSFRAKSGVEFSYGNLALDFDTHFYMAKGDSYKFKPTRADFFATLSYNITDKIKVYAEHLCMHPVYSTEIKTNYFNGGYTSIGISYGY